MSVSHSVRIILVDIYNMCCSPIHIKNRKRNLNPNTDKFYLDVPCGHCPECKAQRYYEYICKTVAEYKSATMSFFFTLTYNEIFVPRVTLPDGTIQRCFSSRDLQLFLKRLRKRLWKDYKCKVRFFFTCEYGENFTKRPHYHGILFLDKVISSYKLKDIIREAWNLGFVYGSKKNNGVVNSSDAITYVTKYIDKASVCHKKVMSYLQEHLPSISEMVDTLNSQMAMGASRQELANLFVKYVRYDKLRACLPFVRSSRYFGFSLLDGCPDIVVDKQDICHCYEDDKDILNTLLPRSIRNKKYKTNVQYCDIQSPFAGKKHYTFRRDGNKTLPRIEATDIYCSSSHLNSAGYVHELAVLCDKLHNMVDNFTIDINAIHDVFKKGCEKVYDLTTKDLQLCDKLYNNLYAYSSWLLFDKDYITQTRGSNIYDHFRQRHDDNSDLLSKDFYFSDNPIIAEFEQLYDILYKFNRVCKTEKYTKLWKEYQDKKNKRDYLRSLKQFNYY